MSFYNKRGNPNLIRVTSFINCIGKITVLMFFKYIFFELKVVLSKKSNEENKKIVRHRKLIKFIIIFFGVTSA